MSEWRRRSVRHQYQLQPFGGSLSPALLPLPCIFIYAPPDSPLISARGILYICHVTLYLMPFKFSLSGCCFFSLPFFPIAFHFTPILSLSLYDSLFLQAVQSCLATVISPQRQTEKKNSQQS